MKRFFALILSLAILLTFAACSKNENEATTASTAEATTAPATETPFDINAYKGLVASCTDRMSQNTVLLSIVALYEQNYWGALVQLSGTVSAEDLYSKGLEYLEKETDYGEEHITGWHKDIMDSYADIISTDIDGSEAKAIDEVFNEYFDAYLSLYNLSTSPSGKLQDFIDSYEAYTSTIENCQIKIEALLS